MSNSNQQAPAASAVAYPQTSAAAPAPRPFMLISDFRALSEPDAEGNCLMTDLKSGRVSQADASETLIAFMESLPDEAKWENGYFSRGFLQKLLYLVLNRTDDLRKGKAAADKTFPFNARALTPSESEQWWEWHQQIEAPAFRSFGSAWFIRDSGKVLFARTADAGNDYFEVNLWGALKDVTELIPAEIDWPTLFAPDNAGKIMLRLAHEALFAAEAHAATEATMRSLNLGSSRRRLPEIKAAADSSAPATLSQGEPCAQN